MYAELVAPAGPTLGTLRPPGALIPIFTRISVLPQDLVLSVKNGIDHDNTPWAANGWAFAAIACAVFRSLSTAASISGSYPNPQAACVPFSGVGRGGPVHSAIHSHLLTFAGPSYRALLGPRRSISCGPVSFHPLPIERPLGLGVTGSAIARYGAGSAFLGYFKRAVFTAKGNGPSVSSTHYIIIREYRCMVDARVWEQLDRLLTRENARSR
jgi:hypothetical protein